MKKSGLTLEDVKNMKFDHPLNEFDIFALKNPVGRSMGLGKKRKVFPRNITKEDAKDLKSTSYTSDFDFDLLVDVGVKARKLYKAEAKKLMIFHSKQEEQEEEEPSIDEDRTDHGSQYSPLDHTSKKQNNKLLIKKSYHAEEEKRMSFISPELSAKRKRTSMGETSLGIEGLMLREKNIKKHAAAIEEKPISENLKKHAVAIEENHKRDSVNKRKRKNGVNGTTTDDQEPELPEDIKNIILSDLNGSDVELVIQKRLTTTDLDKGQNRITMPFKQMNRMRRTDFLNKKEEKHLAEEKRDRFKNGIHVLFIEPNGDRNWELVFKRWDMPKKNGGNVSSSYVLNGKWKDVWEKHKLDKYMIVQVWSFRWNGGELGLAMVIVRRVANGKGNGHGSSDQSGNSGTSGTESGDK